MNVSSVFWLFKAFFGVEKPINSINSPYVGACLKQNILMMECMLEEEVILLMILEVIHLLHKTEAKEGLTTRK